MQSLKCKNPKPRRFIFSRVRLSLSLILYIKLVLLPFLSLGFVSDGYHLVWGKVIAKSTRPVSCNIRDEAVVLHAGQILLVLKISLNHVSLKMP